MSTTARARRFKFRNVGEIERFLRLYMDIIVPYTEKSCKQRRMRDNAFRKAGVYSIGPKDWRKYEMGYSIYGDNCVEANIEPEDFKSIIATGMFRKERICPNRFIYVYVGEESQ